MRSEVVNIELSKDEVEGLPLRVRKKFVMSVSAGQATSIISVYYGKPSAIKILGNTVSSALKIIGFREKALTERNIEKLVDLYLEGEERAEVDLELERDNAAIRADYLKNTLLLTSAQVRERALNKPQNKSEPASRWKREKRIFSIKHQGVDLFPAFQFQDGQPAPVIRKVLARMPSDMSPWQVAFWFESSNGWLDGDCPKDCLHNEDDLISAVEALANEAIG